MPVFDDGPAAAAEGAYSWLVQREERSHRGWLDSTHLGIYPRSHVLAKLRAGQPITVRAVELPARFGGVPAPGSHADSVADSEWWRRQHETLTVTPDDTVGPAVDDGDIYAEYRDL